MADTRWGWKVAYQTATVAKGHEDSEAMAERRASAAHDGLVVKGYDPDALAYFVFPPRPNPFAQANRDKKKAALVAEIDRQSKMNGLDSHGQAVADWIAGLDTHTWVIFAESLKLRAPSAETISQVVSLYRARAMHTAELAELAERRVAQ